MRAPSLHLKLRLPATRAGRALLAFWLVLLAGVGVLIATLQWLGPPPRHLLTGPATPHLPAPQPPTRLAARTQHPALGQGLREPAPHYPGFFLPRIAADGTRPADAYAAPPPNAPGHPRIALVLEGFGLSATDSLAAIASLPPALSLAVSPYADNPGPIVEAARRAGHEVLLSLPMTPARAPLDDEGPHALRPDLPAAENQLRLEWSLSRLTSYAGVTNALSGMGGEQFTGTDSFPPILAELARRGLFYLDATPDQAAPSAIPSASVSLRLDDPPSAEGIARSLEALTEIARAKGRAIAIAGPLYPATVQAITDWAPRAAAEGFVLVPVSSLIPRRGAASTVAASPAARAEGAPKQGSRP